jgi:hypothetical protein
MIVLVMPQSGEPSKNPPLVVSCDEIEPRGADDAAALGTWAGVVARDNSEKSAIIRKQPVRAGMLEGSLNLDS